MAGRVYQRLMATLEDEAGESPIWENLGRLNKRVSADESRLESWYGPTVDELLLDEDTSTDQMTRKRLIIETQRARLTSWMV